MNSKNGVKGMKSLLEKKASLSFTNGWENQKMVVIFYLKNGNTEPHYLTKIETVQEIISDAGGNIWIDGECWKRFKRLSRSWYFTKEVTSGTTPRLSKCGASCPQKQFHFTTLSL